MGAKHWKIVIVKNDDYTVKHRSAPQSFGLTRIQGPELSSQST